MTRRLTSLVAASLALLTALSAAAQPPDARARELGFSALIGGTPGPLDAITDVAGVEVGHTTLIAGSGRLVVGQGPVRTGVTVIHPRGKASGDPVFGAWFTLNGNGEMTGTAWLEESGLLEGPVAITNTHSVGVVRDAILEWRLDRPGLQPWGLPVVAETFDGRLNDLNGFHVRPEHVRQALDAAASGPVAEGSVGGGTGMICHGFKGGIGTASRKLAPADGGYTVGVLVQCNYGTRRELRVAGVPVGQEIPDLMPCIASRDSTMGPGVPRCAATGSGDVGRTRGAAANPGDGRTSSESTGVAGDVGAMRRPSVVPDEGAGSIIIVIATDAPLLPHQLERVATRAALAVGRMGGRGENSSGDIFLAFSTANPATAADTGVARVAMLPNARINPVFAATIQATEESILNAMLAARTMTGANDLRVQALPRDRLVSAMRKYGRAPHEQ